MRHSRHSRHESAALNRVLIAALIALALILLTAQIAHAQQHAQIAFSGGVATDQRGVRSNAVSLAPSAAWQSARGATFALGGTLTQFQQDALSLGGWTGLSHRDRFAGPFSLMIDASASGSRLTADRSSASFLTGEVVPAIGVEFGSLSFFGGARAATGRIAQSSQRPLFPGLGNGPPGTTRTSASNSGAGPTFGADYATLVGDGRLLRLGAREDRLLIEGVTIADRTATITTARDALTLSGQIGRRYASDEDDTFGGGALSLGIDRRGDVALHVAAGRYPSNRLTGSLAGRYLNAGFSFRLAGAGVGGGGAGDTHAPGPRERGAPSIPPGYVRLTIDAPGASEVEVAGDFNEWIPVRAARAPNGVWYADLVIKAGQYRYAFRVDGREWRVPRGATAVDDGFGGKSAWLTVRGS